jgi:hypothetical protein
VGEEQPSAIHVNLDNIVEILTKGVRRSAVFMSIGQHAAEALSSDWFLPPAASTNFHLFPKDVPQNLFGEIQAEWRLWVEAGGFRELCEVLESYLAALYRAALIFSQSSEGKISSSATLAIPKDFSRKGLQRKLELLESDFDIKITFSKELSSLWDARNCLTHRRGIVGHEDLKFDNKLIVSWCGLETVFVDNETGREVLIAHDLPMPDTTAGGVVTAKIVHKERRFGLGERLTLTTHEISEICWFCLMQSDALIKSLLQFANEKGVVVEVRKVDS